MKVLLRVLAALSAVLLLLLIVVIINTVRFPSRQLERSGEPNVYPIDQEALDLLSGAIRFPTISWDDRSILDTVAFSGMVEYLREKFPWSTQPWNGR